MQVDTGTVFWATQILGGAVSPANPAYNASELGYQLKDSGSMALVTSSSLLPIALKAIQDAPAISPDRVYIIDEKHHKSHKTVEELIQQGNRFDIVLSPLKLKSGEGKTRMALICYSSGTTGLPKGVMISHYNMIANVLQTWLLQKEFDDKKRDITLALLPFYHIYGTFLGATNLIHVRPAVCVARGNISWKHLGHRFGIQFPSSALVYSEIPDDEIILGPACGHSSSQGSTHFGIRSFQSGTDNERSSSSWKRRHGSHALEIQKHHFQTRYVCP